MALVIREGDPTTTGGNVVAGSSTHTAEYRKAARISDPVWCPKCKSMGYIAEGNPTLIDEHLAVATEGHVVKCGCSYGSNRLIATQGTIHAAMDATVSIDPAFAVRANAGTQVWARAISNGSYSNPNTAGIPLNEVRGLAPINDCVFAKTCTVPAESTEAGTQVEPASNFGQTVVLGSTAVVGTDGTATFGRVAGQAALEAFGSWSLRGIAMAVGTTLSTLALALWPTPMGDSTLTEEHLRAMRMAPTRVRFQFRRDAEGIMHVYGLHTSEFSGMDSVPVITEWRQVGSAFEATLNGAIITWSPNDGPAVQAPLTYPGITDVLEKILVHPVPENDDSQIEVYPAADDVTWQDYILVLPVETGVPPLYVVFAKPFLPADHSYHPAPGGLTAFPDAVKDKPKGAVQGGGGRRRRWKDSKGRIYEWDSQHGMVEIYDKQGNHLGEFNPETGEQNKPAKPGRKVEK